jgi:hypothetical protein
MADAQIRAAFERCKARYTTSPTMENAARNTKCRVPQSARYVAFFPLTQLVPFHRTSQVFLSAPTLIAIGPHRLPDVRLPTVKVFGYIPSALVAHINIGRGRESTGRERRGVGSRQV